MTHATWLGCLPTGSYLIHAYRIDTETEDPEGSHSIPLSLGLRADPFLQHLQDFCLVEFLNLCAALEVSRCLEDRLNLIRILWQWLRRYVSWGDPWWHIVGSSASIRGTRQAEFFPSREALRGAVALTGFQTRAILHFNHMQQQDKTKQPQKFGLGDPMSVRSNW